GQSLTLRSSRASLAISPRSAHQINGLEFWAHALESESDSDYHGPNVAYFGLPLMLQGRAHTRAMAEPVTHELHDLFEFTILLQDIHDATPEARPRAERMLIDRLRDQPPIKRQAIARKLVKGPNSRDPFNKTSDAAQKEICEIAELTEGDVRR